MQGVTNAAAGTLNTVNVQAVDAYGNPVTTYSGTVHWSSSDALAVLPADTTFRSTDNGNKTLPLTLYTSGNQNVTAVDNASGSVRGTQNNIVVGAIRSRLQVRTPASVVAGQGFNVIIAATDAYGNIDPNYTGTVTLTSSDPRAALPTTVTFGSTDVGQKTLAGVLLRAATSNAVINANDITNALTGSRSGIVVQAAPVASFNIASPSSIGAGAAFSATVTAVDNSNNGVPSYTGTVSLTSNDPNAAFPTSVTFGSADGGALTVANLAWHTAGSGRTLRVTDANGITGTQAGILVTSQGAVALQVTGVSSGVAGHAQSANIAALDSYGNLATGYSGTVVFSSGDLAAVLPSPVTFVSGTPNMTIAGIQMRTAGVQNITVTDVADHLTASQNNIVITGGAAWQVQFLNITNAVAGQAQNIVVAATDAYGNIDARATGSITLSSSDTHAVINQNNLTLSYALSDAGQRAIPLTWATAGTQSISATGTLGGVGVSGTQGNIQVLATSQAASIGVSGIVSGVAGLSNSATLHVYDAFNNIVTSYVGSVAFSSTDMLAALPGTTTFMPADMGIKTVPLRLFSTGTQRVAVADIRDGGVNGVQNNIVVTAAGAGFHLTGPAECHRGAGFFPRGHGGGQ